MTDHPALLLIVDDDDAARFVKAQTLRRAGFRIVQASTGGDALALLASAAPDLVVLDVNLPDMSGLEVSRRIRAEFPPAPAIQILQVSSTAISPQDQVRGLEQGADVYLTEPVPPEVLVATVHALLRVRRAEIALADALARERTARGEAEDAARVRDEFIAMMSHELRTPLNAMMGWIWQLRHSSLAAEARGRALDSIERNARLQVQLISDLLDVSRIAKGKLLLELTRVELRDVVKEALESVAEQAGRKSLQVEVKGPSATVIADYGRLQQIVINLLTNAVQFTPPHGTITVETALSGDDALLWVRDTGLGIEPEMIAAVFDQFQQGPGGQSRKHGGLGLGLAVVRQLIELHDGAVSVESAGRGHGTSFRVRLPREADEIAADPARRPVLEGVCVGLSVAGSADGDLIKAMLETSGAETRPVDEAADAPDDCLVVITDRPVAAREATPGGEAPPGDDDTRLVVRLPQPQARLVRRVARLEHARRAQRTHS